MLARMRGGEATLLGLRWAPRSQWRPALKPTYTLIESVTTLISLSRRQTRSSKTALAWDTAGLGVKILTGV